MKPLADGYNAVNKFINKEDIEEDHRYLVELNCCLTKESIPVKRTQSTILKNGWNKVELWKSDIQWLLETRWEDDYDYYLECLEHANKRKEMLKEQFDEGKISNIVMKSKEAATNGTAAFQFYKLRPLRSIIGIRILEDLGPEMTMDRVQNQNRTMTEKQIEQSNLMMQQLLKKLEEKEKEVDRLKKSK